MRVKVKKKAKIRNRCNQAQLLTEIKAARNRQDSKIKTKEAPPWNGQQNITGGLSVIYI